MLDRTIPPIAQAITSAALLEAQPFHLDNGLQGFYLAAGEQPVIRLEILFKAGKWYEPQPGVSFFTGKMLVEGTAGKSSHDISNFFESLGAFIEVTPGYDMITLTIHLLRKHLSTILPTVCQLIQEPTFGEPELENLKRIKKQRLQVDLQRNSFVASRKFRSLIFGPTHPYGKNLEIKAIESIDTEMVSNFFKDYLKGAFDVIVSGQVNQDDLQMINAQIGRVSTEKAIRTIKVPVNYQPEHMLIDKNESLQSSIRMGAPFIGRNHPDFLNMLVVNEILGGYFGSRLMRNIREDKGYTYGISSAISTLRHGGMIMIGTDVKKEYRLQTIFEINQEIKKLQHEKVPDEELQTVKNYMRGTFVSETDSPFAQADKFKAIHYSDLDYSYYRRYFQSIEEINSSRIIELSRKYLDLETLSQVIIG